MQPDQIIEAIRLYALPEVEALLPEIFRLLPLDAALRAAEGLAQMIEAKNEKSAMIGAFKLSDATVDAAEEADLLAEKK